VLALAPSPASAQSQCAGAHASAAQATPAQAGAAVLCLVNQERARRGLAPLRPDPTLGVLAFNHSRDMVARRYFNHTSLDGRTYEARVKAARWVSPKRRWMVGENISWGSGTIGAPASVVARWMTSPGHRANILHPAFRHAGVGVAFGVPFPQPMPGATYTMDFGLH
jgi:uncharacterized protein YkwD